MKFLIASDSFKGTLSSEYIGKEFAKAFPGSEYIVVSDGGEGFTEAILFNNKNYEPIIVSTFDDKKKPIDIKIACHESHVIFDVASMIALHNYPNESAIEKTTFGIGEVIKKLEQDSSVETIGIGLGGTSTSDGGFGASIALGFKYFDKNNIEVNSFLEIQKAIRVEKPKIFKKYVGFSDVKNPLLGPNGAVSVFGTQKFMTDAEKQIQELNMKHYANLFSNTNLTTEGAGAAGGLGFFIIEMLNGTLVSGIEEIIKISDLKNKSKNFDYLITGEGRFDDQSFMGKVPVEIANNSMSKNILVAGFITADIQKVKSIFTHSFELRKENEDIQNTINNSKSRLIDVICRIKDEVK